MEKLIKTTKTLNSIFSIIETVFFALAIAAAVLTGLLLVGWLLGWDLATFGISQSSLDIGSLQIQIADAYAPAGWVMFLEAAIMLPFACILLLTGRSGVKCIRAILAPMAQGEPFSAGISENLKKLSIISLVLGIVFICFELAELLIVIFAYDLPGLLISEKIPHLSINYTADISFLIVSGILLLLSYIFRYGTELQQLSDETL